MSALTPEQDAEVRAIIAEMIGQALNGANERVLRLVGELGGELAGFGSLDATAVVEARLACLEIAAARGDAAGDDSVVERARTYADFTFGNEGGRND